MNAGINNEGAKARSGTWLYWGMAAGCLFSVLAFDLLCWLGVMVIVGGGMVTQNSRVLGTALVVGIIMAGAVKLPTKYEDKTVKPLPSTDLLIGDLVTMKLAYEPRDVIWNQQRIHLTSTTPKRRDILRAINEQTTLEGNYYHCGTLALCLSGGGGGRIILHSKRLVRTTSVTTGTQTL